MTGGLKQQQRDVILKSGVPEALIAANTSSLHLLPGGSHVSNLHPILD